MDRRQAARTLDEIAVLLDLLGENEFKVRAYRNAARTLETTPLDLEALAAEGGLEGVKGIGKALAEKIAALVRTGALPYYDELKAGIPDGVIDLLKVPGLGPKKVRKLWKELQIESLGELEYACNENRLVELPGFGAKTQANVLQGLAHLKKYAGRFLYADVEDWAETLLQTVQATEAVVRAMICGSIRRRLETVKDIDIVAAVEGDPDPVMDAFTGAETVEAIIARGPAKSSVALACGINADLRVVKPEEFPYAVHHFTGSREHNTAMRGRAREKLGIKINEYGLFRQNGDAEELIEAADEEAFFRALGLQWIEPELRENTGEIQAAEAGELPRLIALEDIRGAFHNHTDRSDGADSMEAMALAAAEMGLEYIGISDHSRSAHYAGGLTAEELLDQNREAAALNKKLGDRIHIFHGVESDILARGELDYEDEVLARLDFVVASVHSGFKMSRERMTARLIAAARNPHVTFIGHPTGRLLLGREAYALDINALIRAAAEAGTALEINANPHRLDMDWRDLKLCRDLGVPLAVNPDAHRTSGLADIRFGVSVARKGWLGAEHVITAWPLPRVKDWLTRDRRG